MLLVTGTALSQGFIIPREHNSTPVLTSHELAVTIVDQVAESDVTQIFTNAGPGTVEGIYYFPIPQEASVSDFAMWVDGKKLEGEILERADARRIYEEIVRRNIDPALLEYSDHRFFRINIFPIPPGKDRKIELKYTQLLTMDNGLVRFLYPLHGESQLGRATEGGRHPVIPLDPWNRYPRPDGEERSHPRLNTSCNHEFFLDIRSEVAIKNVYSPSHDVEISREGGHRVKVSYEGKRSADENDFVLYYAVSPQDMGLSLLTYQREKDGYFLLLVSPDAEIGDERILARDIVFVLDTSGSMKGEKIEQAKEALIYCLHHMNSRDRFALVNFSSRVDVYAEEWIHGPADVRRAVEYVRALSARGGTDIETALGRALSFPDRSSRQMCIVFMTDGLPTVGITDVNTILEKIRGHKKNVRLFTFGIGYDVNTFLLDRIAAESRAVSDYIAPEESIEQKISSFYDKVSQPVLTDLDLEIDGTRIYDVFPGELPDLFIGSQLSIVGRFKKEGRAEVVLTGMAGEKQRRFYYKTRFERSTKNDFLPRLWASRKVAFLLDEVRLHGGEAELRDEIEELCLEYGIVSPYTSLLVQEDKLTAALPRRGHGDWAMPSSPQPVDLAAAGHAGPVAVGKEAVEASKMVRQMRESERIQSPQEFQSPARFVHGQTFILRDGVWIDSQFENQDVIEVKFNSHAYINLLLAYPEFGKYMKLGERIVVKFRDKFIRIGDTGEEKCSEQKWLRILG